MLASSTPKPPPKPRRYNDQLSFLDDLLEKREDISLHEKLDIIIENQKVFFKFMADVMRGGFVSEGRDPTSVFSVGRDKASSVSVGRDGGSSVSVGRDGGPSVSVGRDGESSVSEERDRASSIQGAERDCETLNFVTEDILGGSFSENSIVMGGSCSLGVGFGENDIVSQGSGESQLGSLGDISNQGVMGRSGSLGKGFTGNIVSQGSRGNQARILGDISNVMESASALEEGYREIGNVSWEQSSGEEDKIFMGEALVLKRSSCSVGNFAAKFLSVISKPEELINRNCTGTRGKGQLNAAKMGIVKKYALKLYPCTPAQEDLVWRKCVVAIDEFLRRKKRERQD